MSIQSEITRIENNIDATYDALEEKVGSVARNGSDGLPGIIQGIQTFTTDDTLTLDSNNVLGVASPVQPFITQEAYDNLPEADKNKGLYFIDDGVPPVFVARDPDNNPVGTVISFMGLTPPATYLVCDGTEYNIADYPDLAKLFEEQFEAVNYFGGDGETTFAVPNTKDLFLRGYNPDEDGLSGELGVRQEATEFPNVGSGQTSNSNGNIFNSNPVPSLGNMTTHQDTIIKSANDKVTVVFGDAHVVPGDSAMRDLKYTSRPVNMAVLFCIKAARSKLQIAQKLETYSEEETVVGTWIDGKPVYQKVMSGIIKSLNTWEEISDASFVDVLIDMKVCAKLGSGHYLNLADDFTTIGITPDKKFSINVHHSSYLSASFYYIAEYTKTTD